MRGPPIKKHFYVLVNPESPKDWTKLIILLLTVVLSLAGADTNCMTMENLLEFTFYIGGAAITIIIGVAGRRKVKNIRATRRAERIDRSNNKNNPAL